MNDDIVIDAADPIFGIQLGKVRLAVHDPALCEGHPCCVHHPSDHHMAAWPRNWRADRYLMERMCPHGIGHPDPDDLAYKVSVRGEEATRYEGVHGCDGCCAVTP